MTRLRQLLCAWLPACVLSAVAVSNAAAADGCNLNTIVDFKVTMFGMKPVVDSRLNGHDVRLILDTGAFYSLLTSSAAAELKLPLRQMPGYYITGIGGIASTWLTTVDSFRIGHLDVPKVQFLVGGTDFGTVGGAVGLMGQNVLHIADSEYDLANGAVRLMRPKGCSRAMLAYWTKPGDNYSLVDLLRSNETDRKILVTVQVNGRPLRAELDSGAGQSIITVRGARAAGLDLNGPGVEVTGSNHGIGRSNVRSWVTPVESVKIGDEEVQHTSLQVLESGLEGIDMLIGADFFLSHHVFVSHSQRKLYFTYNGGPIFRMPKLSDTLVAGSAAAADAPVQPAIDPTLTASVLSQRGTASYARRAFKQAIAELSRAAELEPVNPAYRTQLAEVLLATGDAASAKQNLDAAISAKPDYIDALLLRAQVRILNHENEGAAADIDAIDRLIAVQSPHRLQLAGLYSEVGRYEQTILQITHWIDSHQSDAAMASALNTRCFARAILGTELKLALDDCNRSLKRLPGQPHVLDSRALVYQRMQRYELAISDYNAALKSAPKNAWIYYARAVAEERLNRTAVAKTDLETAQSLDDAVAARASRYRLEF